MATNSVALSIVQPPVFDGQNFEFWRVKMETLFRSLNAMELVEESQKDPECGEDKKAMDAGILSIIQRALPIEMFPRIRDAKKAKEAWDKLKEEFGNPKTCWETFVDSFRLKDKSKWLEDMRGMLSLVSTMISSITFQASINPPGGVFQASNTTVTELRTCGENTDIPCAGAAILAHSQRDYYLAFQFFNSICFAASLSVTLLLVSGVPLNHRLPIWILSLSMVLTLSSLTLTYVFAMYLTGPDDAGTLVNIGFSILIWVGIVGIVTVILTTRFSVWLVKKLKGNQGS